MIEPPWVVMSPRRAAGMPPMRTVGEPIATASGGPTHTHMSAARAAGIMATSTVTQPGGNTGPPTCGTGPVTMGQTCMSPARAAGAPMVSSPFASHVPQLGALRHLEPHLDVVGKLFFGALWFGGNGRERHAAGDRLGRHELTRRNVRSVRGPQTAGAHECRERGTAGRGAEVC